jgi:hypothetical protein
MWIGLHLDRLRPRKVTAPCVSLSDTPRMGARTHMQTDALTGKADAAILAFSSETHMPPVRTHIIGRADLTLWAPCKPAYNFNTLMKRNVDCWFKNMEIDPA